MPTIQFTTETIKADTKLPLKWYRVKIESVEVKTSKAGDSDVYHTKFIVQEPEAYAGVPIMAYFTEKAPGVLIKFAKCFYKEITSDINFDPEQTVGREILVWASFDDEGAFKANRILEFKPLNQATA